MMMRTPDYDRAALLAVRTLLELHITQTPIHPAQLIKRCKNTMLVPYDELAILPGFDYDEIMDSMAPAKDALTWRCDFGGERYYIVAYNRSMPPARMKFSLAHELGHIVLNHKIGQEQWEEDEANHFARHLLFPRPLLAECFDRGMQPCEMNFVNLSNCSLPCVRTIGYSCGSTIPGRYNRELRQQMAGYVDTLYNMHIVWTEETPQNRRVYLGRYMEGYIE